MSQKIVCGIDFGTSNSTLAIADGSGKHLIALEDGKSTLPSAIFFRKQAGPLFGRAAIEAYTYGDEGRFMRGLKKILGTSLMSEKTQVGNRSVSFTEILEVFIRNMKDTAEKATGQTIDHAVLGRPVHFHDDDAGADKDSQATLEKVAQAAGFKQVDFLFEPIAAAFAHEAKVEGEKLSLVVDLGGGTSDFTVIRISRQKMDHHDRRGDILSTSGVRIGGTTFDYRMSIRHVMPALGMGSKYHDLFEKKKRLHVPNSVYFQLSDWAMVNFAQTRKAIAETIDIKKRSLSPDKIGRLLKLQEGHLGHTLLAEVEKTKIGLSDHEISTAQFRDIDPDFTVEISRTDFENSIEQDVTRVFDSIATCLSDAGIGYDDINLVILTGGSTELPLINRMIRNAFPHAAISQENKLDSVGLGLAYRAANIY